MGPIPVQERIEFIDILRGFALFGVLAANMRAFDAPIQIYGDIQRLFGGVWDVWVQAIIDTLISGKFVTLFSFLFGLGFAVQLARAEARGVRLSSFYPRRLAALALFGLIHGIVIWAGDILLSYAVAGFLLFRFRNATQKRVLGWAAGIFAAPLVAMIGFYIASLAGFQVGPREPDMQQIHRIINTYAHGGLAAFFRQNWTTWTESVQYSALGLFMICVFLAGLYIWRTGIVQNLPEHRDLFKRVCAWTMPTGLAVSIAAVVARNLIPHTAQPTLPGLLANLADLLAMPVLGCGYATGLALVYLSERWRPRLRPLAALGRMALTNYLMQSVVCVLFYSGLTTGLYGKVGPAMGLIPTVVLYAVQIALSNWWLARYRFGPMEWLWRGMTYGRFPAMRPGRGPAA